ncbi:MAG TPA: 1-deoxy-D-xylulose-5-phosphate reductoisomerase [Clostridiales bacterium]|nr:1-deoxy-D-xylulose-5-phosphate reductoisomerase [Clostridiales bacterium]
MCKKISILGSTGSIGTQALDVVRRHGFKVTALAANKNIKLLESQAREFKPAIVAVMDEAAARDLKIRLADTNIKVVSGAEGVCDAAAFSDCDIVLNSIVGISGLRPTMAAIDAGKTIALANKETLVAGGDLVMSSASARNVKILPVDSEHSAIFQCLQGGSKFLKKIILTASGGPFFGKTKQELANVLPADALKHPNWSMGAKITIDSATLMNKGLEVIEAVHLFGVGPDDIEIVIHRESIIHSCVEFKDGSVIAQLGLPDMKIPIQYALTYPDRYECPGERLSLTDIGKLTFYQPDFETFQCLAHCIRAIKAGGLKPAAANGANEQAVELFLKGKIKFTDIPDFVGRAVDNQSHIESFSLEDVFRADRMARELVLASIE